MNVDYQIVLTDAAIAELNDQLALWKPVPGPNATLEPGPEPTLPVEVLRAAEFAVSGYWKDQVGGAVLNGRCEESDLDALVANYAADILQGPWTWKPSTGQSLANKEYNGSHNDKLAVQNDVPQFDEDGNPLPSVPASFDQPNWGHAFAGQRQRRFSRSVDNSFDGSFG